jgi:hypothetical protein
MMELYTCRSSPGAKYKILNQCLDVFAMLCLVVQVNAVADTPRYECSAPSPAIVFK